MFKKWLVLAMCMLLSVAVVLAQDVPDEIDDPDGDWEDVIEQLDDAGYIDEDDGEIILEESRLRFDDDEDIFILFDTDEITDFVLGVSIQLEPEGETDDNSFESCLITFRDTIDDGYLAAGVTEYGTVNLYDVEFDDEDTFQPVESEEHDEDVDDEFHILIIALDEEVTVYVDGELFIAEDDLNVREGALGLLRTSDEAQDCDGDDLWIWEIEDSGRSSSSSSDNRGSSSSSSSDLPDEIDDFDGASEDVIDELVDEGVLGSGNAFLFGEDYAFIAASGGSFVSLGRNRARTDVVMAGEITFDARGDNYEYCGFLLRLEDTNDGPEHLLMVGLDNEETVIIRNDTDDDGTFVQVDADVDLDDPQHFIIIARDESLAIYLNGELIVSDYPIYDYRGIYGIAMLTDSTSSECEGRNIWVYDTPFFEEGVCNVTASGTVNRREGPSTGTAIAGQLVAGETLEVESQTEPGDGFIWYELEDGSYVREDIISLVGDCSDIPED